MSKLRELRNANNLSMAQLGELAGTSGQTIERLEKGKMELTKTWAKKLAPHLGTTAKELMFPEEDENTGNKSNGLAASWHGSIAKAKVCGIVCAGLWLESGDLLQTGFSQVPSVPTKFPELNQFSFQCHGPSMDLENIRDGDYVVCVSFEEARESPQDKDLVVIERHNGKLLERTVREAILGDGGISFWPRSTDERYRDPVVLAKIDDPVAEDGLSVTIVGLVVGVFSPRG